jgi:hypothetical protein
VTPLVEEEEIVFGEQADGVPYRPVGLAHGQLPSSGVLRMCATIAEAGTTVSPKTSPRNTAVARSVR